MTIYVPVLIVNHVGRRRGGGRVDVVVTRVVKICDVSLYYTVRDLR